MKNNIPTLMQSEEERAPWKTKTIEVNISQCLSCTVEIEVPEDLKYYDQNILEDYVRDQILLPSECINDRSQNIWYVDDFCVM